MELLLILLRHSGYQLRSGDSQALKQIIALVKEKATAAAVTAAATSTSTTMTAPGADGNTSTLAEETGRWKAAFGSGVVPSSPTPPLGGRAQLPPPSSSLPVGLLSSSNENGETTTTAAAAGGSRARYILDTILELQGNKRSRVQEQGQESGRRVRKWLGSVKAAKGGGGGSAGGGGDTSLRVSWAELVSTENRGRWWRVGAAWAGRGSSSLSSSTSGKEGVEGGGGGGGFNKTGMIISGGRSNDGGGGGLKNSGATAGDKKNGNGGRGEVGLLELAKQQRMNTDVRRSVFVAIMGSSDCDDALEKVLRLNLKGAQEREVARVIIECCCQEASYNPFYAHLAERVCDRQPKLRFVFVRVLVLVLKIPLKCVIICCVTIQVICPFCSWRAVHAFQQYAYI